LVDNGGYPAEVGGDEIVFFAVLEDVTDKEFAVFLVVVLLEVFGKVVSVRHILALL
jgi:hypothetical protein